jgi:nitrite reductase (NADH) small subunit
MSSESLDLGSIDLVPPGEGRTFLVRPRSCEAAGVQPMGTLRVAVFRSRDGEVYATQASCPHRAGPLADGLMGGRSVVCPLNGFKFDLATGAAIGHACGSLAVYAVSVDGDRRIRLRMHDEPAKEG